MPMEGETRRVQSEVTVIQSCRPRSENSNIRNAFLNLLLEL